MAKYITDSMAKNGVVQVEQYDLDGHKGNIKSDRHIGLIINAPNTIVKIGAINVENFYKGVELRAAKAFILDEFTALNMWNDSMQITSSNVHIKEYTSATLMRKEYSNSNHPDHLQIFAPKGVNRVGNIIIDNFETLTQEFDKQGNIHLTEVLSYHDIIIGRKGFKIDAPTGYPHYFSAIDVNGLILGPEDRSNTDITKELTLRVKDVKSKRLMSHDNNYIVNLDPSKIIESSFFRYTATNEYPVKQYEKVMNRILTASKSSRLTDSFDFEAAARASGLL